MSKTRYQVGIDLGTTNCVVSYLKDGMAEPELLAIPQNMGDGSVRSSVQLPSAIYLLAADEQGKLDPVLPWRGHAKDSIVGQGALELGQRRSGQLIQSAKSWLSHRQVDRREAILPWGSDAGRKMSPLQASTALLSHIKQSWDHQFPNAPLDKQNIALTLPASFDEEARALTLEAAKQAGLNDLYLLEEPQAACYHFIRHDENLEYLAQGKMLLVVDIGGGTTDFSLVRIERTKADKVALKRLTVGNHLLLGGDNLDQALAYQLDPRQISALSASRLAALVQQTRKAKETLLSEDAPESVTLTVLGGGSRLIGGSQKFTVERDALLAQIDSGFLPMVPLSEPVQKHDYAMHTLGLPYESDAAFTRHLASFLREHEEDIRAATGNTMPDVVLFNGGLFNSTRLKERVISQLNQWAKSPLIVCDSSEPNDAVAKGAAWYLNALEGKSTRIESGVPHSLFLKTADGQFVGLLPKGTSKEETVTLDNRFEVTLGEQVQFPLYRSDDHIVCQVGGLKDNETGLHYVSNLVTELDASVDHDRVEVALSASMTEVGVLQVELNATQSQDNWQLHFGTVSSEKEQDAPEDAPLHANTGQAEEHLVKCFSSAGQKQYPDLVKALKQDLDRLLGDRDSWNLATSRRLADKLLAVKSGRTKSAQHERQWLQLIGFCLRPGYGALGDEARVEQALNATKQGVKHDQAPVWAQHWTLYRRIAGGLTQTQQLALYKEFSQFYSPAGQRSRDKQKALTTRASDDLIRMVGALERLPMAQKTEAIDWLTKRLKKSSEPDTGWWTVGRLASRQLLITEPERRLEEKAVFPLLEQVLKEDWKKRKQAGLAAVLMAQTTPNDESSIATMRKKVMAKLKKDKCPTQWQQRLDSDLTDDTELSKLVGETLPIGLSLK